MILGILEALFDIFLMERRSQLFKGHISYV